MKFYLSSHRIVRLQLILTAVFMLAFNALVSYLNNSTLVFARLLLMFNLPLCLSLSVYYMQNISAFGLLSRLGFRRRNITVAAFNAELSVLTSIVTVGTSTLIKEQFYYSAVQNFVLIFLFIMTLLLLAATIFAVLNRGVLSVLIVFSIAIIDFIANVIIPDRSFHFIGFITRGIEFSISLRTLSIYCLLIMGLYIFLSWLVSERDLMVNDDE